MHINLDSPAPTHRCTKCSALWRFWPRRDTGHADSWSLWSAEAGRCCDNAPMADQIVPVTWRDLQQVFRANTVS